MTAMPILDTGQYAHIVSYTQWILGDLLQLKTPRALCGASLSDEPEADPDTPICPACAKAAS